MKDHYKTLEVRRDATPKEIKNAYRRLALRYHPDKSTYPDAGKLFAAINEAYQVLRDPQKKFLYDTDFPTEVSTENPTHQPTSHSRPKYAPPSPSQSSLILPYLKYMKGLSLFHIVFCIFLFTDRVLPLETYQENTVPLSELSRKELANRLSDSHNTLRTSNGKKISVSPKNNAYLLKYPEIITHRTFLLEKFIKAQSTMGDHRLIPPYLSIYTNVSFVPILLLILSVLQLTLNIKAEASLNLSIISFMMLMITCYTLLI